MDSDLKMIYTLFTHMEIRVIDKIVLNNKLYVLYNEYKDIMFNLNNNYACAIYLTIINISNYKIIKNYKYYGYSSCFTDNYYVILSDYTTLNIYNINDNKLYNTTIIDYSKYQYINNKKRVTNDDIEKSLLKSKINIIYINNMIYICYVKYNVKYNINIINTTKKTIFNFEINKGSSFYKGLNSIVIVRNDYMIYYDIYNHTLTNIYYDNYNIIDNKIYDYIIDNNLSFDVFNNNDNIFRGPIKISDTVLLYKNFTYNTLKKEYIIRDFEISEDKYMLTVKDFLNINSSNIIDNNSIIYDNKIYIFKQLLNDNDLKLTQYNEEIMENKFPNIDGNLNQVFTEDLNNLCYQMLLNNIINKIYLSDLTMMENYNLKKNNFSIKEHDKLLLSKIINDKGIMEYIFSLKFIHE